MQKKKEVKRIFSTLICSEELDSPIWVGRAWHVIFSRIILDMHNDKNIAKLNIERNGICVFRAPSEG